MGFNERFLVLNSDRHFILYCAKVRCGIIWKAKAYTPHKKNSENFGGSQIWLKTNKFSYSSSIHQTTVRKTFVEHILSKASNPTPSSRSIVSDTMIHTFEL